MRRPDEPDACASADPTTTSAASSGTVGDVTSEATVPAIARAHAATVQAQHAAHRAGVVICELHELRGLRAAAALYQQVWQTDARGAPVSPDLMRALSHAGGYVAGAYDGDLLVAASLAFHTGTGTGTGEADLHSHISAVLPGMQGRDVGRALKLHQRSWAFAHGLRTVSWTYDPLLRRNAWFNLNKLGARGVGYLVDFYGVMQDAQNGGDESDRAVALWDLAAPHVVAAARGIRTEVSVDNLVRDGARIALHEERGVPVAADIPNGTACLLVQVPDDVQRLRVVDPPLARRWRENSREVLGPLLQGTYVATGFARSGWYVLEKGTA